MGSLRSTLLALAFALAAAGGSWGLGAAATARLERTVESLRDELRALRSDLSHRVTTKALIADEVHVKGSLITNEVRAVDVTAESVAASDSLKLVDERRAAVVDILHHSGGPRVLVRAYNGRGQFAVGFADETGEASVTVSSGFGAKAHLELKHQGISVLGLRGRRLVHLVSDGETSEFGLGDDGRGSRLRISQREAAGASLTMFDEARRPRLILQQAADLEPTISMLTPDGTETWRR